MIENIKRRLLCAYQEELKPPFKGGLKEWAKQYLTLPEGAYSMPGKVDLTVSKYLLQPAEDLLNPNVHQLNFLASVQTGKSFLSEVYIPYLIANAPGNILRFFQNDSTSKLFIESRLGPLLQNCKLTAPLLKLDRYSINKEGIKLPHMIVRCTGPGENYLHSVSARTVIMDEAHLYESGVINKVISRTAAFAQNKKIVICSQPNVVDSDLYEQYINSNIYEWQWKCPHCNQYQPYRYCERREDDSYSGLNWETILRKDGETDIAASAKTAWLECHHCKYKVTDTPSNRRLLNDTGTYICTKNDGNPRNRTYTWPIFVNVGISFEEIAIKGMQTKRWMKETGDKTKWMQFINQYYGRFYKDEYNIDQSKIAIAEYTNTMDGLKIMTVDVQRSGNIKYYVVREWKKDGSESRRIDYGIARDWEELDAVAKKHNIPYPCVGVDSGDGSRTVEIYGECVKHGTVIKTRTGHLKYICWVALKGDQKPFYKHNDGVMRVYSEEGKGDANFAIGHKLKGIPAPLYLWSNYSIKTILAKLRDNQLKNIKWLIDKRDAEYEQSMYSEDLVEIINKKTGITEQRWVQKRDLNHWFDCESMNLAMAIMLGVFTPSFLDNELVTRLSKESVESTVVSENKS